MQSALQKAKAKTSMGLAESFTYLASSRYMRNLAMLVVGYGMSINIVEVGAQKEEEAHQRRLGN